MAGKGLQKVYEFSQELSDLTGKTKGKRTDAVKWIWVYIKKSGNEFNNPKIHTFLKNGQEIAVKGDDNMVGVFGNVKKIRMFDVGKHLNDHLFDD